MLHLKTVLSAVQSLKQQPVYYLKTAEAETL